MKWHGISRYIPEEDRWEPVQLMSTRRIGVGVAVVNRLLYAVGGYDGGNRLNTVESYHPEKNEWITVANMHTGRSAAGGLLNRKRFVSSFFFTFLKTVFVMNKYTYI